MIVHLFVDMFVDMFVDFMFSSSPVKVIALDRGHFLVVCSCGKKHVCVCVCVCVCVLI